MIFSRQFAELDVALRQGKHLSRHDYVMYEFVSRHFEEIEHFYANFGAKIIQHPDGFYFLLSHGGLIPTRLVSRGVMHLGQFIALKMRDPEITRTDGRIDASSLIHDLEMSVPADVLSKTYAPKQKDVLVSARIHEEIMRSLRTLSDLGFIRWTDDSITPLEAIQRFVELARHHNLPSDATALALKVQRGVEIDAAEDHEEDEG